MLGWNESASFSLLAGVALKSMAVLVIARVTTFFLRSRSAAARHLIWTAAAAGVLALPLLSVALPALGIPGATTFVPDPAALFKATAAPAAGATISANPRSDSALITGQPTPWRPDWRLLLILLWGAGSAVAFAQLLAACVSMSRVRRAAHSSPFRDLAAELAPQLGIRHSVDVFTMPRHSMPMTFGIARPAIFLPCDAVEWTPERRRIVLLHELAHVVRGDVSTQLLARLALIVNWWNPLAWTAWREFLKERERAADDLVLSAGARPSEYATHLLAIASQMSPALSWTAVTMARRSQLEGRLVAILDSGLHRRHARRGSAFVAALVAVALVSPIAAVRAQDAISPAANGQANAAAPPDVDALIRAATAQKNYTMLDDAAALFEAAHQYDTARKLLDSAASLREEVSGSRSIEYGVGLIKLGDIAKKQHRLPDAAAFYQRAAAITGEHPEAAPALISLGIASLAKRDYPQAVDYFEHAQRLDPAKRGATLMWMAVTREREGNAAEAETLYRDALSAQDPQSREAVPIAKLFAQFLRAQGRADEARDLDGQTVGRQKALAAQTAMKPAAGSYRMGAGVTAPNLVQKVELEYSEDARVAKLSGTALVYVEVGPDGMPHNARIMRGLGLGLDENALAAIAQWRFRPGLKDGQPVTVIATVEVNFRLL